MSQDGPRLKKLKEVYKKAIQETLKEKDNIMIVADKKDSFYSDSSIQFKQDELNKIFNELKQAFSEIFKNKIHENGIDIKLNLLDSYIKSNRISHQDIKNENYIEEIFLSHTMDKKEELVKLLEKNKNDVEMTIQKYNSDIEDLTIKLHNVEEENNIYEQQYVALLNEMEEAYNEKINT